MGRGPGKWQRLILDEVVEQRQWRYLIGLLPEDHTMTEYKALWRAADTLWRKGRIEWLNYRCGWRKVLIGPPGVPRTEGRPDGHGAHGAKR